MAGLALAATVVYSRRGSLKSPWSRRRRKHALLPKQWKSFLLPDGKLCDGGVKFLKKVRSGGVDPTIRAEVWPFLLGVYDVNSSKEDREAIRSQNRKEYDNLRKQCRQIIRRTQKNSGSKENPESSEYSGDISQVLDSGSDDPTSLQRSLSCERESLGREVSETEGSVSKHPERSVSNLPESWVCKHPEGSVCKHSEGSVSKRHEVSVPKHPEGSVSNHPEGSVCKHPEGSVSKRHEGSVSNHLEGSVSKHPEGSVCMRPEGFVSKHPEGSVSNHPESSVSKHPEGSVSMRPEGSVSKHPEGSAHDQVAQSAQLSNEGDAEKSEITCETASPGDSESTDSDSSESDEPEIVQLSLSSGELEGSDLVEPNEEGMSTSESENKKKTHTDEDFATWQRIIRLDAVRANADWVVFSPSQASITELKARRLAESVGLKDYDHLEPFRVFHAARLVSILEAYAVYDPEIGYCQGMSDLLSPIVSVIEDDSEAFWCFVGFMKRARHNFRLDEVGIRRQLNIVSKIIKCKDSHLYSHLEKLKAEDCFFVYRMVVVLFRRELNFDQTLCLWEVMWADQAAIRAGIARSAWGRMRLRAPPNEDLLLYAIAASVLQRRKLIIEKYSSMEEIMRECNSMAGHLDVWKLLDDAHELVVNLHEKI